MTTPASTTVLDSMKENLSSIFEAETPEAKAAREEAEAKVAREANEPQSGPLKQDGTFGGKRRRRRSQKQCGGSKRRNSRRRRNRKSRRGGRK
jgi:hypothetical protein